MGIQLTQKVILMNSSDVYMKIKNSYGHSDYVKTISKGLKKLAVS